MRTRWRVVPARPAAFVALVVMLTALACAPDPNLELSIATAPPRPATAPISRAVLPVTSAPASASDRLPGAGADGKRRVLFVGDSLMFGAYNTLAFLLAGSHVESHYVGFTATGLLSGQGWWLRGIKHEVETFDPDIVVIEACCNYGRNEALFVRSDGVVVQPDTEAMFAAWDASARAAVGLAAQRGAKVYWVTTPDTSIIVTAKYQTRIRRFNDISAALGVPLIDWRSALEPDGVFTTDMTVDGVVVRVRRDDGVHFTPAGDTVVARATWAAIRGNFPLAAGP